VFTMARRFSREFKVQAVQRVIEEDRSVSEVARDLGIAPTLLHKWRADYLAVPEAAKPAKETQEQEMRRLRRENERLRQERDFLKKAVGFFSQNPE
jgi:transposase